MDELSCRLLVNLSQELLLMTACHPSTSWNTKLKRSARLPSEFCWLKCMGCVCASLLLCPYLVFVSLLVRITPVTCQNRPYESQYDVLQLGRIICQRKRKFCANMILCVRLPLRSSWLVKDTCEWLCHWLVKDTCEWLCHIALHMQKKTVIYFKH